MKNLNFLLIFVFTIPLYSYSQDDYLTEGGEDTSRFSIGVNLGAHFANKNTSVIYTGSPRYTSFNIPTILNNQLYKPTFDAFFQHAYSVAEYPFEPRYKTTFEIGIHLNYQLFDFQSIFFEFNSTQLKFEQAFTIAVDDPNNGIVGPTFLQFPIIGKENRFHLNLGTQLSLYKDEGNDVYFSIFANVNDIELQENYIVINNIKYNVFHGSVNTPNNRPGGIGYGGGAGMGYKFTLNENIVADIYYNLYYTQSNMNENLQSYGTHSSFGLRVLWKK